MDFFLLSLHGLCSLSLWHVDFLLPRDSSFDNHSWFLLVVLTIYFLMFSRTPLLFLPLFFSFFFLPEIALILVLPMSYHGTVEHLNPQCPKAQFNIKKGPTFLNHSPQLRLTWYVLRNPISPLAPHLNSLAQLIHKCIQRQPALIVGESS